MAWNKSEENEIVTLGDDKTLTKKLLPSEAMPSPKGMQRTPSVNN